MTLLTTQAQAERDLEVFQLLAGPRGCRSSEYQSASLGFPWDNPPHDQQIRCAHSPLCSWGEQISPVNVTRQICKNMRLQYYFRLYLDRWLTLSLTQVLNHWSGAAGESIVLLVSSTISQGSR